jgi:hypothetical protein
VALSETQLLTGDAIGYMLRMIASSIALNLNWRVVCPL